MVKPGQSFQSSDAGVYNVLVWQGKGSVDGLAIEGRNPQLDELLVCHEAAAGKLTVKNTGAEDLVLIKFFGPDINTDVPMLPAYQP